MERQPRRKPQPVTRAGLGEGWSPKTARRPRARRSRLRPRTYRGRQHKIKCLPSWTRLRLRFNIGRGESMAHKTADGKRQFTNKSQARNYDRKNVSTGAKEAPAPEGDLQDEASDGVYGHESDDMG